MDSTAYVQLAVWFFGVLIAAGAVLWLWNTTLPRVFPGRVRTLRYFEALRLMLRFAFHELNLHRLQLTVFAYNEAAIRLYERLGFQREGAFREYLLRDGKRYDMLLYGLLAREWEAQSKDE